jgi:hypothetical protein
LFILGAANLLENSLCVIICTCLHSRSSKFSEKQLCVITGKCVHSRSSISSRKQLGVISVNVFILGAANLQESSYVLYL